MVYVSSQVLSLAPRSAVMQSQSDLAKAQQELASGKLADVGLGLGGQSGQLVSIAAQSGRLQGFVDTNALATARLQSTTAAINTMQGTASSYLATLATANPASSSISTVTLSAKSNLNALLSTLNTSVGGQYIFGGINSDVAPTASYDGSAAQSAVAAAFTSTFGFAPDSPSASSINAADLKGFLDTQFASLFSSTSFPGTWSNASDTPITTEVAEGQSVTTSASANGAGFRTLAQAYTMMAEFTGSNFNAAAAQAVIGSARDLLGQAGGALINANADIGVSVNVISDANDRMTAQKTLLDTQAASLQGVDTYALTSRLSSLQTQIQASFELTSELRKLSLLNYLS